MKRLLSAALIIVICLLSFSGCMISKTVSSRQEINRLFDSFETETTKKVPYVRYNKLILDDVVIDFDELLADSKYDGFLNEVYAVSADTVWFSFTKHGKNENGSRIWCIASVNVTDMAINICYSGEFCIGEGSDKHYRQDNNDHSLIKYPTDSGFYFDGKIVITDRVKTVEYDLETQNATEFTAENRDYPFSVTKEIADAHAIYFSKGENQKVFNVKQAKQTSKAFAKMFDELEKVEIHNGESSLSYLFDAVEIFDNEIYIICRVVNWGGETHAIVFQYDFETNSCKYAFHYFTNDVISNDIYVVPTV